MIEEFASVDELHNHVQEDSVLERVLHFHDKRVVEARQNIPLCFDAVVWVGAENMLFLDDFHSVKLSVKFMLNKVYFTVTSSTNHLDEIEVVRGSCTRIGTLYAGGFQGRRRLSSSLLSSPVISSSFNKAHIDIRGCYSWTGRSHYERVFRFKFFSYWLGLLILFLIIID